MRVVVTGATGNVGSLVVEHLAADPEVEEVVAVARRRPDRLPPATTWQSLDIAVDDPSPVLAGVDTVVHLAWLFQPTHRPADTWRANVVGTSRLLTAMREREVGNLVYASSVGAYSPRTSLDPVDESWPTHGTPTAAYSREKSYVERMLDSVAADRPELRIVRMRPGFIFRRESAVQQRRLFGGPFAPAKFFRKVRLPVLPDPGGVVFQAVHTDDVAHAYHLAVKEPVDGAFNLAADPHIDMKTMGSVLGVPVVRVPATVARGAIAAAWSAHLVPAAPGLFDMLAQIPLLDTRRAREVLGWQPEYGALDAVREVLAGVEDGRGAETPPLDPQTSGRLRAHEVATGVGEKT